MVGSAIVVVAFLVLDRIDAPGTSPFPRSFFLLEPLMFLALTAGARILVRTSLERRDGVASTGGSTRTLVYGAGNAGAIIARMATAGGLREIGRASCRERGQ